MSFNVSLTIFLKILDETDSLRSLKKIDTETIVRKLSGPNA